MFRCSSHVRRFARPVRSSWRASRVTRSTRSARSTATAASAATSSTAWRAKVGGLAPLPRPADGHQRHAGGGPVDRLVQDRSERSAGRGAVVRREVRLGASERPGSTQGGASAPGSAADRSVDVVMRSRPVPSSSESTTMSASAMPPDPLDHVTPDVAAAGQLPRELDDRGEHLLVPADAADQALHGRRRHRVGQRRQGGGAPHADGVRLAADDDDRQHEGGRARCDRDREIDGTPVQGLPDDRKEQQRRVSGRATTTGLAAGGGRRRRSRRPSRARRPPAVAAMARRRCSRPPSRTPGPPR